MRNEARSALLRSTHLCMDPGVGSSQGKLQTGQEAEEPEPDLAEGNGCLSGPRRLHGGPQPEIETGDRGSGAAKAKDPNTGNGL